MNLRDASAPAGAVIAALGLRPHPEGGHYREAWRDAPPDGARGVGTAIHFLLAPGERSRWHRVDAAECWLWQAGGPLRLRLEEQEIVLGPDLDAGQRLLAVVPKGAWQAAEPVEGWALVACTVAPAFSFDGFEMAPDGWEPAGGGAGRSAGA